MVPSWVSLAWTRRERPAASALDPASSSTSLAAQVVREPHGRGPVVGSLIVGAADTAVPVVGGDRGRVAVAEPDAGLAFPLRVEPADLVQLGGGDFLGEQPEHAAGFDGAELGGVAGGDDPGSGLPGRLAIMARSAVLSWLASSRTSTSSRCSGTGRRSSSEPSVLPRNWAML